METRDIDIDEILKRAKRLEEDGDRTQALELYESVLAQIGEDDPRRGEIESAKTYLQLSSILAIAPTQMRAWRSVIGSTLRWRPVRYGLLVLLVLFELGMLLLDRRADFAKAGFAFLFTNGSPVHAQFSTPTPGLDLGLALGLAPTPLAPVAVASPTLEPTPTETATRSPTSTSTPTRIPPTVASPSSSGGRSQGGNPAAAAPSPAPQPEPTAHPGPAPQPSPGTQPGPAPKPGPGPQPTPAPGPSGSGNPGPGGNHGGNGKGKGKGGGGGKSK